jgi:transposase
MAHFPQATIIFDKFHLMMLAGQALEEVRRCLQGQGAELKGGALELAR